MKNNNPKILISGAGPSGLAAAIFLKENGFAPKIIDKKTEISPYSKALALNPNTLRIFSQYGLAERFIQRGYKLPAVNIWNGDKLMLRNEFTKLQHPFPFLTILPQKESEEILLEEALKRGVNVEFGSQLETLHYKENIFTAAISSNNSSSTYMCDHVIGADGAHSTVRKHLDIHYQGFHYNNLWELYDIELETDLKSNEAHIRLFNEGGMIMIPIKNNVWRLAGKLDDLLGHLPKNCKPGKILWETAFNVNHHVAESVFKNNAVLIGDAAHLHSPIGGRGMNLGIEDAYIVSKLISKVKLHTYGDIRLKYLQRTVNRINFVTDRMTGTSSFSRFMRTILPMTKFLGPLAKPALRNFALGLDKTEAVDMDI